jgi:hypothetical protein
MAQMGEVQWTLETVDAPSQVKPGQVFGGSFTSRVQQAVDFDVTDPDYCVASNLLAGVNTTVQIVNEQGNPLNTENFCYPAPFAGGSPSRTMQFAATAPETEGTVTLTIQYVGNGSDNLLDEQAINVEVSADAPDDGTTPACSSTAQCPEGFTCENGQCVPENGGNGGDGGIIPGDVEGLAGLAVLGIGLYAVGQVADAADDD